MTTDESTTHVGTARPEAHRRDIDGLRAVAVGLVVAYHAGIGRFAGGYVGVDVFFVLSGFLITGILLDETASTGTVSLRRFWARRARRLLPMSSLVLLATLVAGLWIVNPVHRASLVSDVRHAALYASNWRSAGQAVAYSDTDVTDSLTLHFWSLSIEEQFYVLWPLLVAGCAFVARRTRGGIARILAPVTATIATVSLWFSVSSTGDEGTRGYFLTRSRIWELAAGALLAMVLRRRESARTTPGTAGVLAATGAFLVVIPALLYGPDTVFPGTAALAPVSGACLLVAAGALAPSNPVARILSWRPFTLAGEWSYSIYLWHWPAIGLALLADEHWNLPGDRRATIAAAVAASIAAAAVSHRIIENPVRRSTRLAARPVTSLALGAVLMAVPLLAAGLATTSRFGIVSRPEADGVGTPVTSLDPLHCAGKNWQFECSIDPTDPSLSVVVIGDSHADNWMPALLEIAAREGWELRAWVKHACMFNGALTLHVKGHRNVACLDWQDDVFDRLGSLGHVDVVIVARRGLGDEYVLSEDGLAIASASDRRHRWGNSAVRAFARLAAHADRVIVLRDTPYFVEPTIPECLALHGSDPAACDRDLSTWFPGDEWMVDAERAAGSDDVVTYAATSHIVCPANPCTALDPDGNPKFEDSHHLARRFVRANWNLLRAVLSPLLPTRG